MKKWRSIRNALEEIKELDPKGAITEYGLRKMVRDGDISHMMSGRNILIDMNEVWGDKSKGEEQ